MELNDLLLWMVVFGCGIVLVRAVVTPMLRPAVLPHAIVLIATAIAWLVRRDIDGYVAGGIWGLIVLLPMLGQLQIRRLMLRYDFAGAARVSRIIRLIHPTGLWRQAEYFDALALAERGEVDRANAILTRLEHSPSDLGSLALVHRYRIMHEWHPLVLWFQARGDALLKRWPSLLPIYLRGLGEIGTPNAIVEVFYRLRGFLDPAGFGFIRAQCRLSLFAFTGGIEEITQLFARPLRLVHVDIKRLWRATAFMTAGQADRATSELRDLLSSEMYSIRQVAQFRLDHPLPVAEAALSDRSRELIEILALEWQDEERYADQTQPLRSIAWMTYILMFANAVMFLIEVLLGGSTNGEVLLRLGAVHPLAVFGIHQYWRIIAANFLHFGIGHLLANLLGLFILGRPLEAMLGHFRFLVVYLLSGIIAIGSVMLLQHWEILPAEFLVGASGSIMGLVGGSADVLLRGWVRHRARIAARRLRMVLLIIVVQVIFDWLTPQVSFAAHAAGVIAGFALTSMLSHGSSFTSPARSQTAPRAAAGST